MVVHVVVVELLGVDDVVVVDRREQRLVERVVELEHVERDGVELDLVELQLVELEHVELEHLELRR